jgi:hypothetical protein
VNELEALRRRMNEYKEQVTEYLLAGGAKDYVQYAKATAKVEAIEIMLADITEIEQRYIED